MPGRNSTDEHRRILGEISASCLGLALNFFPPCQHRRMWPVGSKLFDRALCRHTRLAQRRIKRGLHVIRSIAEMRELTKSLSHTSLGFVPTMGALHEGHLTLLKRAKAENQRSIASIFVNPTQFSAGEDFDKYPRTLESDIDKLKGIDVDFLFAPERKEVYSPDPLCHVEPTALNSIFEGSARPEFFRGVATVVTKLFNIVQPTVAYFGQKDISQCILIHRMVSDLNIPVDIQICETIREVDGLAMSSRNVYLSPEERKVASILYKALDAGKMLCEHSTNQLILANDVKRTIESVLSTEPMVSRIEYISIAGCHNMAEIQQVNTSQEGAIISAVIRLGSVRLIDNLLVGRASNILKRFHHY